MVTGGCSKTKIRSTTSSQCTGKALEAAQAAAKPWDAAGEGHERQALMCCFDWWTGLKGWRWLNTCFFWLVTETVHGWSLLMWICWEVWRLGILWNAKDEITFDEFSRRQALVQFQSGSNEMIMGHIWNIKAIYSDIHEISEVMEVHPKSSKSSRGFGDPPF